MKDIALKFGSQVPKSKPDRFPKELSEHLFHLRTGPLLGSIFCHADERSVLRNLFLNASFDLSLRSSYGGASMSNASGRGRSYQLMIAMQSHTAGVLYHGTDVKIWLICFSAPFLWLSVWMWNFMLPHYAYNDAYWPWTDVGRGDRSMTASKRQKTDRNRRPDRVPLISLRKFLTKECYGMSLLARKLKTAPMPIPEASQAT